MGLKYVLPFNLVKNHKSVINSAIIEAIQKVQIWNFYNFRKMLVKTHTSYRTILAVCDSNLIGKTFEEGEKEIKITENFFKGEEKTEQEVLELFEKGAYEDYTFNIVGEESVNLALKSGLIKSEGITKIQGIPIALILL